MNIAQYRENQKRRWEAREQWRQICLRCRHAVSTCYCHRVKPFSSKLIFIILIQREESRRPIATGRMAHLCLANSFLYEGLDFSEHSGVNQILSDPRNHCVLLFPSENSTDISLASPAGKNSIFPKHKQGVVFILDGTWRRAKRMKLLSQNLANLPVIRLTPSRPSNFRIRKQPQEDCFSTIEAIHEVVDLLVPEPGNAHANMLEIFNEMVDHQIVLEDFHRKEQITR